jgi:hypothetical protein
VNIDATEGDLFATAEVLKLAAILDDRAPRADKARIAAWAEQIHRHTLARTDLLDGLQAFYDSPHDRAIGIGDLIHHARYAKRARLDKEEDAERDRRRAEFDAKADDDIRDITAEAITGRIKNRTPRLEAAEAALQDCHGKRACIDAIREFNAAKAEAAGRRPKANA